MGAVVDVFALRVSGASVMFVRQCGAWHMLTRQDGKLEPRRVVPDEYAMALIESYAVFGPTEQRRCATRREVADLALPRATIR